MRHRGNEVKGSHEAYLRRSGDRGGSLREWVWGRTKRWSILRVLPKRLPTVRWQYAVRNLLQKAIERLLPRRDLLVLEVVRELRGSSRPDLRFPSFTWQWLLEGAAPS